MKAGPENYGEEIRQSGEQKALRRIETELKKLRRTVADLEERAKGETFKRFESRNFCDKKRP
jgi:hypothetical protein